MVASVGPVSMVGSLRPVSVTALGRVRPSAAKDSVVPSSISSAPVPSAPLLPTAACRRPDACRRRRCWRRSRSACRTRSWQERRRPRRRREGRRRSSRRSSRPSVSLAAVAPELVARPAPAREPTVLSNPPRSRSCAGRDRIAAVRAEARCGPRLQRAGGNAGRPRIEAASRKHERAARRGAVRCLGQSEKAARCGACSGQCARAVVQHAGKIAGLHRQRAEQGLAGRSAGNDVALAGKARDRLVEGSDVEHAPRIDLEGTGTIALSELAST